MTVSQAWYEKYIDTSAANVRESCILEWYLNLVIARDSEHVFTVLTTCPFGASVGLSVVEQLWTDTSGMTLGSNIVAVGLEVRNLHHSFDHVR